MGFYDLPKEERDEIVKGMEFVIKNDLSEKILDNILDYASDEDTYIRKNAYTILGRAYRDNPEFRKRIIGFLKIMLDMSNPRVRQTAVHALGEIGKTDARSIVEMLERALEDEHKLVKNAVIGALKQMGEKNPRAMLAFARRFYQDPNPRIRHQIIHGMELRGRSHPEDILPLLKAVQHDKNKKVQDILLHVLSQISYKKKCLETVVSDLKTWKNKELVRKALQKILETHVKYKKFAAKSEKEARSLIQKEIPWFK
ncbi:MAG: HEAT repeat domain-containing protein [Candidatus Helarchaeota archaeon]